MSMKEKKEFLFKVLVIGDLGTGKTSIIKRYVHQFFSIHYRATVSFLMFDQQYGYPTCMRELMLYLPHNYMTSPPKEHITLGRPDVALFGYNAPIMTMCLDFFNNYKIGVDFALKVLNWNDDTLIRLQLWDIAGQERFGNMTRVYYKEAVGAFVVFDVTRATTYEAVEKWKSDLDSKVFLPNGSPIPAVLLANKCDQVSEGLYSNTAQMNEFCAEKGFAGWFETSAKENIGIDEAASFLVNKILENESTNTPPTEIEQSANNGIIRPGQGHTTPGQRRQDSGCC